MVLGVVFGVAIGIAVAAIAPWIHGGPGRLWR
jgi:hypothetical protein